MVLHGCLDEWDHMQSVIYFSLYSTHLLHSSQYLVIFNFYYIQVI